MAHEGYRKLVLEAIRLGHSITQKKGVPAKKSPTGKAIKAVKAYVPGCVSKTLFSKAMKNKTGLGDVAMEAELTAMRKAGVIHCTNGMWWKC